MKPRTHTCAAAGCQHQVPLRLLMCVDHWRMVPIAIRREFRLRLPSDEYWDVVKSAIAAVKEKQERKAAAQAGPSGSLFT